MEKSNAFYSFFAMVIIRELAIRYICYNGLFRLVYPWVKTVGITLTFEIWIIDNCVLFTVTEKGKYKYSYIFYMF